MTYPITQPATPPAKPKGMLIAGIVLIVLAIVVFVVCMAWGTMSIVSTASDAPVFESPGEVTTTLEAGEHALWTNSAFLWADDVTITGPTGEVTGSDYYGGDGAVSLTRDGTSFTPEVTFNAPTTGSYTVEVDEGGPSTDVLVGPPTSVVTTSFAIIALAFVAAGILGFIGLILLIVGLVKRSKSNRPQGPPPGPYGQPGYGQPAYGQPQPYGQAPGAPPGTARCPAPRRPSRTRPVRRPGRSEPPVRGPDWRGATWGPSARARGTR